MLFSFSSRRRYLIGISSLVFLLLTGCGPNKVDECRKIAEVINRTATDTEANLKKGDAARLEEVVNNLSALQLKDKKVQEFQSKFVESYRARQKILEQKASQTGNVQSIRQLNAELTVELGKGQVLEQEFATYCRGN